MFSAVSARSALYFGRQVTHPAGVVDGTPSATKSGLVTKAFHTKFPQVTPKGA